MAVGKERRWKYMENNTNRIGKNIEKEPMSLAGIIESFMIAFKKFWFVAVIVAIVGGIFGYTNYKRTYVPSYTSQATFAVTAPEYNGTDESYTNNNELASILSVSFNYIINNEVFYEIIKADIGLDYVPSIINIVAVEDTNMLSITTTGPDAQLNYDVINSVMNNYSSVAEIVIGDTELDVLEHPTVPSAPTNPYSPIKPTLMWIFIGFIFGLVPSVMYAIFVKTIKSKEDVEKYLSITCFGSLPAVQTERGKKVRNCSIIDKEVGFRYLEAMRTISNRLEKELVKNKCKVVLITSTEPNEGKSTFAMNLAYSLSKVQNKVMLIDGDLRKPGLRKLTNSDMNDYDMKQFLDGELKSSQAVINIPNTRVLLLAPNMPTEDPIECLNSNKMEQFIEEAKDVVDYIIIDAPPCSTLSDAAVLAKYSDGMIYVVKEDSAKVNKVMDALQEISYTRIPIIGCILNEKSGALNISYGYGRYGYGYGKAYGGRSRYYGRYGYGAYSEYGEVTDKEFRGKERKVSKHINLTTTDEQRAILERERLEELKNNQNEENSRVD